MSSFRIRPRFEQIVDYSVEEIQQRISSQVKKEGSRCNSRFSSSLIYLTIPPKDQHYWSPQLSLSLEEDEDLGPGQTRVRGLYGPNPNIWAMFFYGYAALGILGTFAGIIGLSQWSMDQTPWGLWALLILTIMAIGLYMIAQTGQKLGAAQTFILHHAYEEAMDNQVEIH